MNTTKTKTSKTTKAKPAKTTKGGRAVFIENLNQFRRALRKGFNLSEKIRKNQVRNPELFQEIVEEIDTFGNRVCRTFPANTTSKVA